MPAWRVECIPAWAVRTPTLYVAARLMWDVDTDVDALLAGFYPPFSDPPATPWAPTSTASPTPTSTASGAPPRSGPTSAPSSGASRWPPARGLGLPRRSRRRGRKATDALRPGGANTVAVRILNEELNEIGTGGITAPVLLRSAGGDSSDLRSVGLVVRTNCHRLACSIPSPLEDKPELAIQPYRVATRMLFQRFQVSAGGQFAGTELIIRGGNRRNILLNLLVFSNSSCTNYPRWRLSMRFLPRTSGTPVLPLSFPPSQPVFHREPGWSNEDSEIAKQALCTDCPGDPIR